MEKKYQLAFVFLAALGYVFSSCNKTTPTTSPQAAAFHSHGSICAVGYTSSNGGLQTLGLILLSSDGGATWSQENGGAVPFFDDVAFADSLHGCIIGHFAAPISDGVIIGTTDGGKTWTPRTGTQAGMSAITFGENGTGLAMGLYGSVMVSTDSGATWAGRTSGSANELDGGAIFHSDTMICVGRTGTIIRSTDRGVGWVSIASPLSFNNWTGAAFNSAGVGLIVGSTDSVLRSTDFGRTWYCCGGKFGYSSYHPKVVFTNDSTAYLTSGRGVSISHDLGATWRDLTGAGSQDLSFGDQQRGIVVGYEFDSQKGDNFGEIVLTTDGGNSWTYQGLSYASGVLGACFLK